MPRDRVRPCAPMNFKRKRPRFQRASRVSSKPSKNLYRTADRMKGKRDWRRLEGLD